MFREQRVEKAPLPTAGSASRVYALVATASTSMASRTTTSSAARHVRNCRLKSCRNFKWATTVSRQNREEGRAVPATSSQRGAEKVFPAELSLLAQNVDCKSRGPFP